TLITTTAPSTSYVPITVHKSPTTDNSALIRSGPISYAKLFTGEPSRKSVNFCTLIASVGNGADVAIPLESVRAISELFANTAYGFFGKTGGLPCSKDELDAMLKNDPWFIRNNLFILKKWNPDVNLQKEDVGNVSVLVKFNGVPMTVLSYARAMIELRADGELKHTIVVAMPKLASEGFNLCIIFVEYEWKPPRFSSCKGFGHILNECPKKIVSDVVMNNPRQATRGVPVSPKIDKLERQILNGKLMFMDDDGNPLVPKGNVDSESEVEAVFGENANLMASTSFKDESDRGYGTNSLLEQWKKTKQDDDYDSYDDDLNESHDMSDHLQTICDDLDITVSGRNKK
ncbi:copia protein, partial [Tanacetum coccineum]